MVLNETINSLNFGIKNSGRIATKKAFNRYIYIGSTVIE